MTKTVDSYEDVRDYINDGDIVFFRSKNGPLSRLIKFFTKSKYSHVSIAFWLSSGGGKRLMLVEAQGGAKRRIVNMSYHGVGDIDVIAAPKRWDEVGHQALDKLNQVSYGWLEALYIGVREFLLQYLNIKIKRIDLPGEICSEYIANVYELPKRHIGPQILFEHLLELGNDFTIKVRR